MMSVELLRQFLGWCTVLDVGILAWWFLWFWLFHDPMYRFHSRLCQISVEQFDTINYAGLACFKIGIFLFNLVPYLALTVAR